MKNVRALLVTFMLPLMAGPLAAQSQTVFNNGAPNGAAGFDIFNDFRAADDFTSSGGLSFDLIRFWGLLPTGFTYTPTIFWQILQDAGGAPGATAVASGSVAALSTLRTSVGGSGFDSWQFDLNVGLQSLGPGIFWLALHDGAIGDITDSTLLWEQTGTATGSQFAVEFGNEWSGNWGGNLAFELQSATVTPEPVTMVLLGSGLLGLAGAHRRRRNSRKNTELSEPKVSRP